MANKLLVSCAVAVVASLACGDDSEPRKAAGGANMERPDSGSERPDAGGAKSGAAGLGLRIARLPSSSANSHAFGAADHMRVPIDLAAHDYVEEEFIVAGGAKTYDWADSGAVVRTEPSLYTTRVLVRRPKDRAQFSGRVVLELLNPTNRFDLQIGWALSHEHFMREGDAWVGLTSKPIAVVALKAFDPERYAGLSWANPLPDSDMRNCSEGLASDSSQQTENGLVWDIFSQLGRLLRSDDATLLGGYPVQHLYAFGYSQSGGFLGTYIEAIHPLDVQELGHSLFDAYLVATYSGVTPIHQCTTALPRDDPRAQPRDVGVPVMRILTQSDFVLFGAGKRANSARLPDAIWFYEIAGAAHATPAELDFAPSIEDLMKADVPLPATECEPAPGMKYPRSPFPLGLVFNAAWKNLERWAEDGVEPPEATPLEADDSGMAPSVDEHGNARGGLRTPIVDVPTGIWHGNAARSLMESLICFLAGYEEPFGHDALSTLYADHDTYVERVRESAQTAVEKRFLLEVDAQKLIEDAMSAEVP